jgi:hypothetical protein
MRTGRTILPTMLAVILVIGAAGHAHAADPSPSSPTGGTSTPGQTGPGFATPEAAIHEYLAGVARSDAGRILGASAIDEMSTGFDFVASVDRLKVFIPTDSLAPAEFPLYADVNRAVASQRILRKVLMLAYSLLSSERLDDGAIAAVDADWAEGFARQVDPARLAGIAVEDIRFSDASLEHDPRYLANTAALAGVYGADELTERLVLLSFEGQLYDVGFTLVRYGDLWKVIDQGSTLAGTDSLGTARATTVEEYQNATSGDEG